MHIGSKMEDNTQRYRLALVSSAFSHISSYLSNPNRPSAVSMLKRLLPSSVMSYTRWDQYNSLTAVPKQNMGSSLRSLCTTPLMSPLFANFEAHASSVHPNSCSQTCIALGPGNQHRSYHPKHCASTTHILRTGTQNNTEAAQAMLSSLKRICLTSTCWQQRADPKSRRHACVYHTSIKQQWDSCEVGVRQE